MNERTLLLGLVASAAFVTLCLVRGAPRIENDIRERSIVTAAKAGVGPIYVQVNGRDVTLRAGPWADTRLDSARVAIAALRGVRNVTVEAGALTGQMGTDTTGPRPHKSSSPEGT